MRVKWVILLLLAGCVVTSARAQTRVVQVSGQWQIENASIRVTVMPDSGQFSVLDKRCGYLWKNPQTVTFPIRQVQAVADGVRFQTDLPLDGSKTSVLNVTLQVPPKSAELRITAEAEPPDSPFAGGMLFLAPLVLDTPHGAMAIADYCNGHLYPLDTQPFPARWQVLDRLDMPWVGVCDLQKGFGYALIVETADDGILECKHYRIGEREVAAPQVGWWSQKGHFAYPRRIAYHFVAQGGYVALAKAYRNHAKQKGLLVTLREKARRNPNLHKLFGATDVWGVWGVNYTAFVQEAKALGIQKLILHGRGAPEAMKKAVEAGYLTSEYDDYADILPVDDEAKISSTLDLVPASVVLKADGERMTAWRTMEGLQYMKRCPALWVRTAKKVIPAALASHPFLARFIDVTTAEGLYECYDPNHPLNRTEKRHKGEELLAYVRSLGLVVGGEHGIWWGVPYLDYIEGMMSSYQFAWPAGHLIRPQSKEQTFTDPWGNKLPPWSEYEKWGIGHQYRIPLWELVFHDCVVSTWYWGDSSDFLLQADPENMTRKDLFNILYGTIPLMWLEQQGAWHRDRQAFLRTYRLTTKLHEAVAQHEMLSHEFLTPDRAVQRTRFADGTTVVVNFGEAPYSLKTGNSTVTLPKYGFWVKGPRLAQSRVLVNGTPVTNVRSDSFWFRETPSEWVFLRRVDGEFLRLEAYAKGGRVRIDLRQVTGQWDKRRTLVYASQVQGRDASVPFTWTANGLLELSVGTDWEHRSSFDILCGKHVRRPDIVLQMRLPNKPARQGQAWTIRLLVRNLGYAPAREVRLNLFADVSIPSQSLWQSRVSVSARSEKQIAVKVDTSRLDGNRLLIATASLPPNVQEISTVNNTHSATAEVVRDLQRWDYRRELQVDTGSVKREDEVVVFTVEKPPFAPESVRVYLLEDETRRPLKELSAQCDRLEDGRVEIALILPGKLPAGTTRRVVLYAMRRAGKVLPPRPSWYVDARSPVITGETYRLYLRDGIPHDIAAVHPDRYRRPPQRGLSAPLYGEPFINQLVFSSARTGWIEEPGTAPSQVEVLSHGPVRTIVRVKRTLAGGVTYTKRYTFYPQYFDVEIETNTSEGVYSRAFYRQQGDYEDSGGVKARVDGKGEAEGVMGSTKEPRWYAVYAPRWAHACLALTPAGSIVYWDSPAMGGIGFSTQSTTGVRLRYVIVPGAQDASFAQWWYRRATEPAQIRWEPD
ncbi:MAG: glycoside hydrolase [Armatimonadota bacterium]